MTVLGIETSCDETSAAVLREGRLASNIISSQLVHRKYGGVVPELASRAHLKLIGPVVQEALTSGGASLAELNGIAVTYGPGLMGALMVGVNFAKGLSYGLGIPFVGVNHLEAHIHSNFLEDPKPSYPFLCLLVSGGHTQLAVIRGPFDKELLGETLDDAAGEAYDKVAKLLGLGFPGGPAIDKLAKGGNPAFVRFPRSLAGTHGDDFSFSGIKTAVLYWLRNHRAAGGAEPAGQLLADLCASFQAAVVEVLVGKALGAAQRLDVRDIAVAGGVSANSELRRRMEAACAAEGKRLFIPKLEFCTDNAAMVGFLGWLKLRADSVRSAYDLKPVANLSL